jgi:hypothetical protein
MTDAYVLVLVLVLVLDESRLDSSQAAVDRLDMAI